MALKKRKIGSKGATPPSLPFNSRNFIIRVTKENYNTLSVQPFVLERGFLRNNPNFHFFLYNRRHWKKLCEHLNLGVVLVLLEFHVNLYDRICSTVFV